MEKEKSYEQYNYARQRVQQKKMLFFHFVVFALGSLLMFCINTFVQDPTTSIVWWPYAMGVWAIVVFLHTINVLIVNRFMGKQWEDKEIARLIELQQKRIKELRAKVEKDFPLVDVKRDLIQDDSSLDTKNDHPLIP